MTDADRIATLTDYLRNLATRCSRLSQSVLDDGIAWISDEIREVLAEVTPKPTIHAGDRAQVHISGSICNGTVIFAGPTCSVIRLDNGNEVTVAIDRIGKR